MPNDGLGPISKSEGIDGLNGALEELERADGELILDFSSIRRLDGRALDTLEKASAKADERGVRLVVRAASVEVYLVLKLVKLAPRFAFQN